MATLAYPHWDQVSASMRQIFAGMKYFSFMRRFYLAGGTAAVLQLGHRTSKDLKFFSARDELGDKSRQEIITNLQDYFASQVIEASSRTLLLNIQDSVVGFFNYDYPLQAPLVMLENIALASLLDIGLMKIDTIVAGGARKDFYDLYFIAQHVPLEKMLSKSQIKYPNVHNFGIMALAALVDISVAEAQPSIETSPSVSWTDVKGFFVQEVRRISQQWFNS